MHQVSNVLYHIKKESFQRSSPDFQPNSEHEDLRKQLSSLRVQLRAKDTQIIRLQGKIDELQKKVTLFQFNSKQTELQQQTQEKNIGAFSQIPMIFENKELKQLNLQLESQNLTLNGKNNILEGKLRQSSSNIEQLNSKLKELTILQKMREERFKDELQRLTPIIVEDSKDILYLKDGTLKLVNFLRQNVVSLLFDIFLKCAKECEGQKKVSSFTIFRQHWQQLKASKNIGLLSVAKAYQGVKKLSKVLEESYAEINEEEYRDTLNDWVIETLVDIKHTPPKKPEQRLFRYLGLLYRSKFPIKNERFDIAEDLQVHFEDLICQELYHLLQSSS